MNKKFFFLFVLSLFFVRNLYAEDLVKAIKFEGLNNLTKYEIVKDVKISSTSDGILIDTDSLKNRLSKLLFIKNFTVIIRDKVMIISIIEKEPLLLLYVRGKKKSLFLEVDKNNEIISKNKIHKSKLPIIVISKKQLKGEMIDFNVVDTIDFLKFIKQNYLNLYNEIEEIDCSNLIKIKLKLKNRNTNFFIKLNEKTIIKIIYLTGYFDRLGLYPDNVSVDDKMPSIIDRHKE